MTDTDAVVNSGHALGVGDPRRAPVGRAVAAAMLAALVFFVFEWASKEIRAVSAHAPWQNDPYDLVVSFTLFFVPLGGGVLVMRALLCRRDAPVPLARLVGVLRASRVVLGAVLVTLAADWLSVLLQADRATWDATTGVLVAALAATTLVTLAAAAITHRATAAAPAGGASATGPDVLADALALGRMWVPRLGPLGQPAAAILRRLETDAAPAVRRHPLAAAAGGSVAFAAALTVAMATEEGIQPVLGLVFGVGACGMFAFLSAAGAYLGVVLAERPLVGVRRRAADAAVLAAAAVPIALGFRDTLWWVVGATNATAGIGALVDLLLLAGFATFVLVAGVESLAGVHGRPAP